MNIFRTTQENIIELMEQYPEEIGWEKTWKDDQRKRAIKELKNIIDTHTYKFVYYYPENGH